MIESRAEREKKFFDELAKKQGEHWWGNLTLAGQLRQDIRAQLAIQYAGMNQNSKVLEIGCGTGQFSRRFLHTEAMITAIDISPNLIQLAKEHPESSHIDFKVANAEKLEFSDETFDAVIGNAILHHLSLDKVLPEFKRILRKGGKMFFAEPNMANPQVWLVHHVKCLRKYGQVSEDETAFYQKDIFEILRNHGFDKICVKPFDFLHPSTPEAWIPFVRKMGDFLENTFVGTIAGSLLILAQKKNS